MDGIELTPEESDFLASAGNPDVTRRRIRSIIIIGTIALAALVLLAVRNASMELVAATAAVYVLISVYEKVAMGRGVLVYKAVIRKLLTKLAEMDGEPGVAG